jgi:hypothetical protein
MNNSTRTALLTALMACATVVSGQDAPANTGEETRACGTPHLSANEARVASEAGHPFYALAGALRVERVKFLIPVAFHVIHDGAEGNVSDAQIRSQLRVMNQKLGPIGYSFTLHSIDRTDNATWNRMIDGEASERDAKIALRKDPTEVLNFYVASARFWWGGVLNEALGIATFPHWMADENHDARLDGVIVAARSFPGVAPSSEFSLGYTAVHEVGHWLGLMHTFQGGGHENPSAPDGCVEPGDYVADTPYERNSYEGPGRGNACESPPLSSCPTGGLDPIRNYMDYASDRCMSEWTAGQDLRARAQMQRFRASFVDSSPSFQRFQELRQHE